MRWNCEKILFVSWSESNCEKIYFFFNKPVLQGNFEFFRLSHKANRIAQKNQVFSEQAIRAITHFKLFQTVLLYIKILYTSYSCDETVKKYYLFHGAYRIAKRNTFFQQTFHAILNFSGCFKEQIESQKNKLFYTSLSWSETLNYHQLLHGANGNVTNLSFFFEVSHSCNEMLSFFTVVSRSKSNRKKKLA